MIRYIIILVVIVAQSAYSKTAQTISSDSLTNKDFDYFKMKIAQPDLHIYHRRIYANAWLLKAKRDHNCVEQVHAYKSIMYSGSRENYLFYADSIIAAAKQCGEKGLIGDAYLTKGVVLYEKKEVRQALDNYLIADDYISRSNDQYLIHKVKYGIGLTKYYLGFYAEAVSLFTECVVYFEEDNDRAYLNSLHMLGLSYNRLNDFIRCSIINKKGLAAEENLENFSMHWYFIQSEGVNQYFLGNYEGSLSMLLSAIPQMRKNGDLTNEVIANFYVAKCYLATNRSSIALPFLQKIDQAFLKENYIRPDLRESYELLIMHYKKKDDQEMQLLYINKLLDVDKVLNLNYRYLSTKIFKIYDTNKLLAERSRIVSAMKATHVIDVVIIGVLVGGIIFLVYRHFANQRRYRKIYEDLIKHKIDSIVVPQVVSKDVIFEIKPDVVASILKHLEKFESTKKYLAPDMTLNRLADILHTNTKYVTKVIQRYRGKGTIEYISDLKIQHITELLKTQKKYRRYTNEALAEEAGFGSTQNFTKAFNAKNSISPTYFIQQLNKDAAS